MNIPDWYISESFKQIFGFKYLNWDKEIFLTLNTG
jgi:hypothetical protein